MAPEIVLGHRAERSDRGVARAARIFAALDGGNPRARLFARLRQRQLANGAEGSGRRMCGAAVSLPEDEALAARVGDPNTQAGHERIGYGVALAGWRGR